MGGFKKGLQLRQVSWKSAHRYLHFTGAPKQISNCNFRISWRIWIKFCIEYHQVLRRTILSFIKTSAMAVLLLDGLKYFSTTFGKSFVWFRYNSVFWYIHKKFLAISFLKVDAVKIIWLIGVNKFIFLVPCIVILGWRNPTRCNCIQIFIYCQITLPVSSVHLTHHQEYIKLQLQPPDDECDGRSKYVE